jgi:hypothetical protein
MELLRVMMSNDLDYMERMQRYKETIPEEHHDELDKWAGEGRSPKIFCAVWEYETTNTIRRELLDTWGVHPKSIYRNRDEIEERVGGFDV